ncbi:molybdopterin converting factor subunit 1 [Pseudomonadota bacterium]
MKVKIKLFASLRDSFGYAERDIEVSDGETLDGVWKSIATDSNWRDEVLMAVNRDYANPDTLINDGDEIAFFPPVTGG